MEICVYTDVIHVSKIRILMLPTVLKDAKQGNKSLFIIEWRKNIILS